MRNVIKQAENGRDTITNARDLTAGELQQLFDILKSGKTDAIYDSLVTAYYFGFAVGCRQGKQNKHK